MTFMTKHIFLLFLNVKLLIDYNLCSVMTSLKIDGYKLLTHQRPTGNGGGVCLYVRNI